MTRYPRQGKGRRWTAKELQAVPAIWKGDTLSDGDGLSGEVRTSLDGNVSVAFRFAFKWEGKVSWHYCGTWPMSTLEAIRTERDHARSLVRSGVRPTDAKRASKIEAQAQVEAVLAEVARKDAEDQPVRAMYESWLRDGVARADGNAEIRRSFEKDVLPSIGSKPVREVTEHDLRALLRQMLKRGVHRQTVRTYNDIVQMFSWQKNANRGAA